MVKVFDVLDEFVALHGQHLSDGFEQLFVIQLFKTSIIRIIYIVFLVIGQ